MHSVRPNARRSSLRWRDSAAIFTAASIALAAALACAKGADKAAAVHDTGMAAGDDDAPGASGSAPVPSAHVDNVPGWPSDTSTASTDRDGRIPDALAASVPSCGTATPVFAGDSVGPVFPGMPLANLFAACKNPLLLWHSNEGVYAPAIALKVGTALLLLDASGTTSDDVITRIIGLQGVRTADGIGPGSTLAEVGRAYGEPTWTRDQCGVTAGFASHTWLYVHINLAGVGGDVTCDQLREFATGSDFSHFPRGTKISAISTALSDED
ncbi:MAG: hypothetical protein ACJ79K_10100 [Gemmatimonadaceae bacterium]